MSAPLFIKVKPEDNVAIAVQDIPQGTQVLAGVKASSLIPQAHKIALRAILKDQPIIRYGVVLGYAKDDIAPGDWIKAHMVILPESPALGHMPYGVNLVPMDKLPEPPVTTWMGYKNAQGPAGTRNLLGDMTTVQCVAGVARVAPERIRRELLPKCANVDGVVGITHP